GRPAGRGAPVTHYRREAPGTHPPLDYPDYRSTALRHPHQPLGPLPHRPSEGPRRLLVHVRRGDSAPPTPPTRRPPPRPAGPQPQRRRPLPDRRQGPLQVRDRQAGRLPLEEPPQRLAAGAHPLLAVRAVPHPAADHPDVLPRRPVVRLRPDPAVG